MKYKKYPSYKDSGVEWLGEVPEHWEVCRIKNSAIIFNGATPKSVTKEYWDGDISWIGPADMGKGKGREISCGVRNITTSGYNSCGTNLIPKGSVILSSRAPIGKVLIAENTLCTNQGCKSLVIKKNFFNIFVFYILISSTEQLNLLGRGTTFLELSGEELSSFNIPFPTLQEQQTIANYLDTATTKIDTLIKKQTKLIELLKEKRQSLISHVVTKGINPDMELKDSGVEWLGDVPNGWIVGSLKRGITLLTDFEANGSFADVKANVKLDTNDEFAWYLRATDLENKRQSKRRTCDEQSYKFLKKTPLYGKELLIAKRGEIGKIYITPEIKGKATLAPNLYLLRMNNKLDSKFAYYWYSSSYGLPQLLLADKSTTIGALYKDDVKDCKILYPPLQEQQFIANYLDDKTSKINKLIEKSNKSIEQLNEKRTALIRAAVTGKIDVRELV